MSDYFQRPVEFDISPEPKRRMVGVTPEQQAVLDAAERWADGDREHGARNFIDLAAAVDALRASQSPPESSS